MSVDACTELYIFNNNYGLEIGLVYVEFND